MSEPPSVVGRFAPSPTGPLHLGSLYTAVGSFLQARSQQGLWRVRIDDLDTPRTVKGADSQILAALEAYGLHWDGAVMYQSHNRERYGEGLRRLEATGLLYPCVCSRKALSELTGDIYPGTCRNVTHLAPPYALRVKTDGRTITFTDGLQGPQHHQLAAQHGDFILKRRDGIIAYPFAAVIDDELQQVTQIVRGVDLLAVTPKQIYLQQLLGFSSPRYRHVPVIVDATGAKLSKQNKAPAVALSAPERTLFHLLKNLGQQPPTELHNAPVAEQLTWAVAHWRPAALKGIRSIGLHYA